MNKKFALFALLLVAPSCCFAQVSDLSIVDGARCTNGGSFKDLKNSNKARSIRATIRIDSTPNPGSFPQERVVTVAAGGRTSLGCSRAGGSGAGGGPDQYFQFSIIGAEYN